MFNRSNRGMLDEEFSNKEKGVFCLTPASPSDYESIIDFSTPTPPLSPAPEYQLVIIFKIEVKFYFCMVYELLTMVLGKE